jgi:hypothetical protein
MRLAVSQRAEHEHAVRNRLIAGDRGRTGEALRRRHRHGSKKLPVVRRGSFVRFMRGRSFHRHTISLRARVATRNSGIVSSAVIMDVGDIVAISYHVQANNVKERPFAVSGHARDQTRVGRQILFSKRLRTRDEAPGRSGLFSPDPGQRAETSICQDERQPSGGLAHRFIAETARASKIARDIGPIQNRRSTCDVPSMTLIRASHLPNTW